MKLPAMRGSDELRSNGNQPIPRLRKGKSAAVLLLFIFLLLIFLLAGCGILSSDSGANEQPSLGSNFENPEAPEGQPDQQTDDASSQGDPKPNIAELKAGIDLAGRPNEAGKIMVLMYHNIGPEEAEWVRTPANFLKDMNILYDKGYRPVSLRDYVNGEITTEQGFTPVIITFDDGNLNNFEYLENGQINEESAVGLLMVFHQLHPDFPLEATFFLNGSLPFRQKDLIEKKLNDILDNGMDIGNHTKDHDSFKNAGSEAIQEQIGAEAQYLEGILQQPDYRIDTMALPFGERPKDQTLMGYLAAGSYNGIQYENIAILNVGWNPGFSPYDGRFDPASIPRVRASETKVDNVGLYNYLDYFDRHPEERFISDGVAEIITVPSEKKEMVQGYADKEIYAY